MKQNLENQNSIIIAVSSTSREHVTKNFYHQHQNKKSFNAIVEMEKELPGFLMVENLVLWIPEILKSRKEKWGWIKKRKATFEKNRGFLSKKHKLLEN